MKLTQLRFALIGITALVLSSCSTVTLRDRGVAKIDSEPTYSDSKPFFLWGIVGKNHVDVKTVCNGRGAVQLQSQQTFVDGLLGVITLGIYSPRTAKVWCNEGGQS
jgi:hypothetical protein